MRFSRYTSPLLDRYSSAAVCALMVMPRSRSSSMLSSTCSAISRSASPPHIWMKRSASVDLPWSMCAMIEKLRMRDWGTYCALGEKREILAQLGDRLWREAVFHHHISHDQHRDLATVLQTQIGIGIDVDFVVRNLQSAQLRCHLLAEMAAVAAVQLTPCQ